MNTTWNFFVGFTLISAWLLAGGCSGLVTPHGPIDDDAPTEFTTTDSGLQYRVLRKSDGERPGSAGSVKAHYVGKLDDGTVFSSTYNSGKPGIFRLNEVIPGWTEGLRFVGEGGMIELIVPPELAYGSKGRYPNVPPDATLNFRIELVRVF